MDNEVVNPESAQNSGETATAKVIGRPFVPGDPRINKGGRPKRKWLTEAFEELLERKLSDPAEREAFIQAQWGKLLSKTVVSSMLLEKMLDRTEGKLTQPVDVSGQIDIGSIIAEFRDKD
jgi:hypothetical protein